jgi:copper oxidase (laccase) domain-containing protein
MFSTKNFAYWSQNYKIQNDKIKQTVIFHLLSTTRNNPNDLEQSNNQILCNHTLNNSDRYSFWNMGQHVEDDATSVSLNRQKLANILNQDFGVIKPILWLNQTHSANVFSYEKLDIDNRSNSNCLNSLNDLNDLNGIDGLITINKKTPCCVMTADCIPIFLWNEQTENPAVAMLHAGWQGFLNGVIEEGVLKLKETLTNKYSDTQYLDTQYLDTQYLDTQAFNLKAFIGVHLNTSNFEIGIDLIEKFDVYIKQKLIKYHELHHEHYPHGFPKYYDTIQNHQKDSTIITKYYLNLSVVCQFILNMLSVELIGIHEHCTYQHENLYYSHRRQTKQTPDNKMTGRMAHLIWFETIHESA